MSKDKEQKEQPAALDGGQRNCILGICCPPRSEGAVKALAAEIAAATGLSDLVDEKMEGLAYSVAKWALDNFDLAPKGSLQAFKDAIRDYAREGYVPGAALPQGKIVVEGEVRNDPGLDEDDKNA